MIYIGTVTNNDDPEKRGRIKFKSDILLGKDMEYPKWAEPVFPFVSKNSAVFFFVPDVEMPVEIEFDPDEGIPRYRAGVITNANPLDDRLKKNYPHRRGIKTSSGHILIFDDKDGDWLEEIVRDKVVRILRDWLVEVAGKVEVKTSKIIIDSPHIELGKGATEKLVLGNSFMQFLNTLIASQLQIHTHPTPSGPSGPPSTAFSQMTSAHLSQQNNVTK